MLLSVIVPTYNCKKFLDEGLNSIICQLSPECELIVVDDGSSDGTADQVSMYEGRYENVRIRLAKHQGASGARNIGIDMSKGKYITFMDCDDCMIESNLEKYIEEMKTEADLYIYGFVREYLSGEKALFTPEDHFFDPISDLGDELIRGKSYYTYSNCNKLYKRSLIDKLSLRFEQKTSFGEDRLFNYTYMPACQTISTHSRLTFRYIERSKESMSTKPVADYMTLIKRLHDEKLACYCSMSTGTTPEEIEAFRKKDWEDELRKAEGMSL